MMSIDWQDEYLKLRYITLHRIKLAMCIGFILGVVTVLLFL